MVEPFETISDQIRGELRWVLSVTDKLGRPIRSQREIAREAGIAPHTLSRFLAGRQIGSDALDRLHAWLARRPIPGTTAGGTKPPAGAK